MRCTDSPQEGVVSGQFAVTNKRLMLSVPACLLGYRGGLALSFRPDLRDYLKELLDYWKGSAG